MRSDEVDGIARPGWTPEPERADLVSVGRFALRGVGRAQDLFTIVPSVP